MKKILQILLIIGLVVLIPFIGSYVSTNGFEQSTYQRLFYWLTWNGGEREYILIMFKIQVFIVGILVYILAILLIGCLLGIGRLFAKNI